MPVDYQAELYKFLLGMVTSRSGQVRYEFAI